MTKKDEVKLEVNREKYPRLIQDNLLISIDGINVVASDTSAGVGPVVADTRDSLQENWELAQESLSQAIELLSSQGMAQPEAGGHR